MKFHRQILIMITIGMGICASAGLLAMAKNTKNEPSIFSTPSSITTVSGRIIFQSNRDVALSEIWIFENGQLENIISGNSKGSFPFT